VSATMRALADLLPADALSGAATDVGRGPARASAAAGRPPESVVRPGSTGEVAALMSWASREGVGVLAVGSGARAVPVSDDRPYVLLSTARLTGIDIYEAADLTLTAGAGTPFRTIAEALGAQEQWAPFDPPFVLERTLGGLVASGQSGPLWMGYGEVRNHVLGATVVTGDGRTLRLGGRVVKNVAGYDLLKAVVGSRGTLAVITSVCIRAFPRPAVDRLLVARGDSLDALADLAVAVGTAPVMPVSSVLVDEVAALPGGPRAAALLVRLHGAEATVEADRATLQAHLGRDLENVDAAASVLEEVRDRGADGPVVIEASARPSRLRSLLTALEALGAEALVLDTYAGRARLGGRTLDPGAFTRAKEAVERLGGALRVVRAPDRDAAALRGSAPSADEARLTMRLRSSFDPQDTLWPGRG
jgi:glycolate oxidase FAD binding subunit